MTKEQAQRLDEAIAKYNEVSETPMYWWDVTAKITDFNNTKEIDAAIEVIEKMIKEISEPINHLMDVVEEYNELQEDESKKLDWHNDIIDNINDLNDEKEIRQFIKDGEAEIQALKEEKIKKGKTMKAINISVYRDNRLGDCTNGGISSKYDELLLVCEDGYIEIDENNLPENLVVIAEGFRGHKYIRPYKDAEEVGWMSGGNIAYSSDARFNSEYPLKIHDRQETQEMYDRLSR